MLLISVTIIGFCFTLYFQSDLDVKSMNIEQYKDLNYNESRSHSLADIDKKIIPLKLENLIQEIYEKNKVAGERTRIMEIGPGNGRVLMELTKMFPDVEFYGINKEKTKTFYRRESYMLTALKFEIFTKADIDNVDLPYIVFQDLDFGARIPYGENKFDLVYTQGVLPLIKYKFEFLNEIMRIMKPGGFSFHTEINRINIYSRGVLMDFREALKDMRKRGHDIYLLENQSTLRFKKTTHNVFFPVVPHQPIPSNTGALTNEQRRPYMGYNLIYE
jgi:ubiquinone/menaquinone biosynthesis C-methylase UbiE